MIELVHKHVNLAHQQRDVIVSDHAPVNKIVHIVSFQLKDPHSIAEKRQDRQDE